MGLPRMARVKQSFDVSHIEDVPGEVKKELAAFGLAQRVKPGMRVAITAGSRGIANIADIISAIVAELRSLGAEPLVVPAMGSHGGATAEGQREMLAGYGIVEERVGAPIISSMDVVEVGRTPAGMAVYVDREAYSSDGILVVNRVKAHTAFKAPNESGLVKMMAIGLGKRQGADTYHRYDLGPTIVEVGRVVLEKAPILGGLAIVENSLDETWKLVAVGPERMIEVDRELLAQANTLLPRVPFESLDVLIVDEMGKNISGTGMDLNVIGIWRRLGGEQKPYFKYIVVLDLTEESHGNALGIGMADLTTRRVVDKIDLNATYTNVMTTNFFATGKIPFTADSDREALDLAFKTFDDASVRAVRIKNTLALEETLVSEALLDEVRGRSDLAILDDPQPLAFTGDGRLK
ncbi:MAG: nickel pincer cofactor-dependent isomerase, group 22 [Chloroflexota bacterium]